MVRQKREEIMEYFLTKSSDEALLSLYQQCLIGNDCKTCIFYCVQNCPSIVRTEIGKRGLDNDA